MLKFVTFNIRCDYDQDGANSFRFRKPGILKKIREEAPDILCFQEVLPHVADWLSEVLEDYTVLGAPRSATFEDEQETIAFRKERFYALSLDTYWLSPTPYVPGSRYEEQSICPRVTTEAVLYDKESKQFYRVVNTHLDHEGTRARELGLRQIMEQLKHPVNYPAAAVILAGDFNAEPDAPELRIMREAPEFQDAAASVGGTFHDYGKLKAPEKIDYIYVQSPMKANRAKRWEECENGVYLSDHYPVSVEIYTD